MGRLVALTRKVSFSSGHRYWLDDHTEDENKRLFGKWASRFNDGHNYVLWVTSGGPVDPVDGMVVNIKTIDTMLQRVVVERFDQKSINDEVSGFEKEVPCLENLLRHFQVALKDLPGGVELKGLRLDETPLFYGEWTLEDDMLSITRVYEFAAAHRLAVPALGEEENWRLFGKCHNEGGHGHNYVLEVTVTGKQDPDTGYLVDLEQFDEIVANEILDRYDHKNLNTDVPELKGKNTTSEVVAMAIFDRLEKKIAGKLVRIRLFETARNVFEVTAS